MPLLQDQNRQKQHLSPPLAVNLAKESMKHQPCWAMLGSVLRQNSHKLHPRHARRLLGGSWEHQQTVNHAKASRFRQVKQVRQVKPRISTPSRSQLCGGTSKHAQI